MIDFKNVSKVYPGDIVALDNISFALDPEEFTFVIGPSGAGKSTILKLLIRQELPTV
jgi:cell division transport system ATP-binding protein